MARIGKSDKAQRQARRQRRQRTHDAAPPESSARRTHASNPPPLPREEVTAVRERGVPFAQAHAELVLDDDFFAKEAESLDSLELDEDRENPVLSPAQHRRRHQLRRQVAALVVALSLFTLLALALRFAG